MNLKSIATSLLLVVLGCVGVLAQTWTVYDYNPSGRALAPRVSANSQPASTVGNTTSFDFIPGVYTALLTTNDKGLTGDLSSKTLNATVSVTGGSGTFLDQNNGGCQPDNQYVRFYFKSASASGYESTGFYTQFWWSNPQSVPLVSDPQTEQKLTQTVNALGAWSDWDGKLNTNNNPATQAAFEIAIHNVQTVGLSFGGGCFFENGVTTGLPPIFAHEIIRQFPFSDLRLRTAQPIKWSRPQPPSAM